MRDGCYNSIIGKLYNQWAGFLNPDIVRTKLCMLGLYICAYELLNKVLIERLESYYVIDIEEPDAGGATRYREEVLVLDPKCKSDRLRSTLVWLERRGAINNDDLDAHRLLVEARNEIAHEMPRILMDDEMPRVWELYPCLLGILSKVERWWIANFDLEFGSEIYGDTADEDLVIPGSQTMLQMLSRVALGRDDEAWELYSAFTQQFGQPESVK